MFKSFKPESVAEPAPKHAFTSAQKARAEAIKKRPDFRIGIPRMLNQYSTNPLFSAYFESLGVRPHNLVYSDYTTEDLYKEGAKRGSIDPCFPSKLGIPHVHNLLFKHHEKKALDVIFFPMIDDLNSPLAKTQDCRACPTVTATPEAVKAAFTKEGDWFAKKGIKYLCPVVNISQHCIAVKCGPRSRICSAFRRTSRGGGGQQGAQEHSTMPRSAGGPGPARGRAEGRHRRAGASVPPDPGITTRS